jgi:predicted RND superfamily exporter protein
MFCATLIGVGVDYAVFLLAEWERAPPASHEAAAATGLRGVAFPILMDALALACGFATLIASRVPTNSRLGCILAIGIATSCVVTLVGLLPLLHQRRSCARETREPRIAARASW